jgi:hypothetical protein
VAEPCAKPTTACPVRSARIGELAFSIDLVCLVLCEGEDRLPAPVCEYEVTDGKAETAEEGGARGWGGVAIQRSLTNR